ncbi:MAG: 2Fe-2S iron-sulfur cluster binding domain-containing protein [Alphaproteobacteria bacterium]|nr:2Fe-2S iron-sulfur cluster binding domain-containing protein [Alphaproteobacteria bacterium]
MLEIVFLTNGGKTVTAPLGSNLLRMSMRQQGGLPFKCGGGICGTCKCKVEQGLENTAPMTKKEQKLLTEAEVASGHRLGCQTMLNGPVAISWVPLDER